MVTTRIRRRPGLIPPEPEDQFQAAIVDLAIRLGWRVYHTYDSRRSAAGFPDLFMVRGKRAIAAELKSAVGRVDISQNEWLLDLGATGIETYVFRPRDKQRIVEILSGAVRKP